MISNVLELEWHFEKNGNLKLSDFSESSAKKVWWQCQKDKAHIWEARIFSRRKGARCPFCTGKKFLREDSVGSKYPHLLNDWNYEKNSLDPYATSPKSGKKVWWKCNQGHEWQTMIRHRTEGRRDKTGTGCPYCSNQRASLDNSLINKCLNLLKEWDYIENNGINPADVVYTSRKKVWWKCKRAYDHKWKCSVYNRTVLKTGCPCCLGKKVVNSNCLMTTHPDVIKEWNYDKNNITPSQVTYASNKKVWWKCSEGHEWQTKIYARTRGDSCPLCRSSYAEKMIKKILAEMDLSFIPQYKFKNCLNKRLLPFDFAIINYGEVIAVIEYQGRHHYKIMYNSPKGKKKLAATQINDQIKRQYCKDNKIPLLEIPYWEFKNIKSLLISFINNMP